MNKYLLLVLSIFIFLPTIAQKGDKYLSGAVPEVNGKVVFNKTITTKEKISDEQLFNLMNKWAVQNYKPEDGLNNRVLLTDPAKRNLACAGEKYLVFQRSALVLDRALMNYQLIMSIDDGKCDVTVRNIKYDYSDSKESHTAEEMITDKFALNKSKDKLNRYYDKFRTHTVDSVNSIFNSIDVYLNGINTSGVVGSVMRPQEQVEAVQVQAVTSQPVQVKEEPVTANVTTTPPPAAPIVVQPVTEQQSIPPSRTTAITSSMDGYRQVAADKIPGNIIKLLSDAMLITSGTSDQTNVMTASWGGIGRFWEKPVAFCFLNPTRYSIKTMDNGDTYTLSFYTEAYRDALQYCGSVSGRNTDKIKGSGLTPIKTPSGATAFAEAWMILECKKIVAQPISSDAVTAENLPGDWSKNGYHKMYIGEILNVWIK